MIKINEVIVSAQSIDKSIKDKAQRSDTLQGETHRVTHPSYEHPFFVTINYKDKVPYEVFINSRDVNSHAWVVALTRVMSLYLREGGEVNNLCKELMNVMELSGGYLKGKGHYVASIPGEIGRMLLQQKKNNGAVCPQCGGKILNSEGCLICESCGYSKCS